MKIKDGGDIERLKHCLLIVAQTVLGEAQDKGTSWSGFYDPLKTAIEELQNDEDTRGVDEET